jgi:integrase/recombinase XerD
MNFRTFLEAQHTEGTVKRYWREWEKFSVATPNHKTASYRQIMFYLGELRKTETNYLQVSLSAIKKYYDYLVETKQRKDHPAAGIELKDKRQRDVQLQDLFSSKELEKLLERKERYSLLEHKNKVIISLLIYQGLTNSELKNLTLKDIDLEKGTVRIKATTKTNKRTLKLRSNQVFWLMSYILKDREKLVKIETSKLIISKKGTAESGEGISYLIETFKPLFSDRNLNPKTIRQSVIANLLKKGKDLRKVQVFAGHKYPSSTERYRQNNLETLKHQGLKYHPLDK